MSKLKETNAVMSFYEYCAAVLAVWMVYRWFSRRKLPPGPPSMPILGCVPFLPEKLSLSLFLSDEMHEKYGSVVRFDTGVRQFYVLNDFNQVNIGGIHVGSTMAKTDMNCHLLLFLNTKALGIQSEKAPSIDIFCLQHLVVEGLLNFGYNAPSSGRFYKLANPVDDRD